MGEATVWASPRRQAGQPCLMGTRMPTITIGRLMYNGYICKHILEMYPHLTEQQVWDAIEFEALNGRGKAYRRYLQSRMTSRRRDLSGAGGRVEP